MSSPTTSLDASIAAVERLLLDAISHPDSPEYNRLKARLITLRTRPLHRYYRYTKEYQPYVWYFGINQNFQSGDFALPDYTKVAESIYSEEHLQHQADYELTITPPPGSFFESKPFVPRYFVWKDAFTNGRFTFRVAYRTNADGTVSRCCSNDSNYTLYSDYPLDSIENAVKLGQMDQMDTDPFLLSEPTIDDLLNIGGFKTPTQRQSAKKTLALVLNDEYRRLCFLPNAKGEAIAAITNLLNRVERAG